VLAEEICQECEDCRYVRHEDDRVVHELAIGLHVIGKILVPGFVNV
jgi:hypothetical protein